ncbi:hypothetical protein [Acinetobacter larvae]|uniref:Uncharacterized protein n=1 Tax=Acinetobacter larvae TaxID=1789224 RepID=A0A1B2LYY5_9GAMM|nr:hypothetical protein [Acinetobacter larvae]AOA58168.1 hypothetical protein BFG52_07240 [Acinetobacter larvae]
MTIHDPVATVMDISSTISGVLVDDSEYDNVEKTVNTLELIKADYIGINDDPYYNEQEIRKQEAVDSMLNMYNGIGAGIGGALQENWDKDLSPEQILSKERSKKAAEQKNMNLKWEKEYFSVLNKEAYNSSIVSLKSKKKKQANLADHLDLLGKDFLETNILDKHICCNIQKNNIFDCASLLSHLETILGSCKVSAKINAYISQKMYDINDTNNYILNAISLNNMSTRETVNEAVQNTNSNNILGTLATQHFADLLNGINSWLGKMSERIKNTVLVFLEKSLIHISGYKPPKNFKIHPLLPITTVIATQQEIKVLSFKLNAKNAGAQRTAFNRFVVGYLKNINKLLNVKNDISTQTLLKMVDKHPYWNEVYQRYLRTGVASVPVLDIDKNTLANMPKQYSGIYKEFIKQLTKSEMKLDSGGRVKVDNSIDPIKDSKMMRFSIAKTGVGCLQVWAFTTIFSDNSLSDDNLYEKSGRRFAATLGLFTSFVEFSTMILKTFDGLLTKSAALRVYNNIALEFVEGISFKSMMWRGLGLIGGFVFGFYDIYNGYKAYNNGEKNFGFFLAASGLFLMIGSFYLFMGVPIIGVVFLFLAITYSIVASVIRDDKFIRWTRRCMISIDNTIEHFKNFDDQCDNLKELYK